MRLTLLVTLVASTFLASALPISDDQLIGSSQSILKIDEAFSAASNCPAIKSTIPYSNLLISSILDDITPECSKSCKPLRKAMHYCQKGSGVNYALIQCSCSSHFLLPLSECARCEDSESQEIGAKKNSKRDMFESQVGECTRIGLQPQNAGSANEDGTPCGLNPVVKRNCHGRYSKFLHPLKKFLHRELSSIRHFLRELF